MLSGSDLINYAYAAADRMTVAGAVYVSYDPNGNMIQKGDTTYEYDPENRLIKVTTPSDIIEYAYDGDGNRISKIVNGVTTKYIYDITTGLPQVLMELDELGNIQSEYINGSTVIGKVYGENDGLYYHYDGLGSVVAVTDDQGQVVASYDYDVFGAIKAETGSINNDIKFTGEQMDSESGLIYLRSRYYDPTTGRFITKDSFAGFASDPRSLNRYAYAYNNPVNLIDPSGHSPLEKSVNTLLDLMNEIIMPDPNSAWDMTMLQLEQTPNPYSYITVHVGIAGIVGRKGGQSLFKYADETFDTLKRVVNKGTGKRWKVGDDVYKPTAKGNEPAWNTVKQRFWKNKAAKPDAVQMHGAENVERMKKGNALQRYNPDKGGMESMELSHEPIPKRDGGKEFVPRWPQDHAKVDPFRHPGY